MKADDAFLRDWQHSHASVFTVARWLRESGYLVRMNVPRLRKSAEERFGYSDEFDLEVTQGVEVKHRSIDFTGPSDYPFASLFVDEVYKVNDRLPRILGYVIVNRAGTHVAMIPKDTRPHWTVQTKPDKAQARECSWYCCPKERAKWAAL